MASTYLSRTPSSAGSTQTGTFSAWVKKGSTATTNRLFAGFIDSNNFTSIFFRSVIDEITITHQDGGANTIDKKTTASFRDVNGWYHIVVAFDLSNGTAEDRIKLYVNGARITSFSPNTNPSSSDTIDINSTSASVLIGYMDGTYFNGSMAHVHWIDGTAYDASAFGEVDSTTNIWKAKTAPSVTYGTNGFFLKFENSGSMGTDSSGNGNNFTVSGNLTQTVDTPSNVFATFNPLAFENAGASTRLQNGNLRFNGLSSTAHNLSIGTLAVSQGKYYAEFKLGAVGGSFPQVGIRSVDVNNTLGEYVGQITGSSGYNSNGAIYVDGTAVSTGLTTYTTGDIIGVGLDLDGNKIYYYKNGTLINTGGTSITNRTYTFAVSQYSNTGHWLANFGNGYFGTTAISSATTDESGLGTFEYTVPTGYYALCTKNINTQEYS